MSGINRKRVTEMADESRAEGPRLTLREQFLWAAATIERASTLEELEPDWPAVAKTLGTHMKSYRGRRSTDKSDMATIQRIGPKLNRLFKESSQEIRDRIEVREGGVAFFLAMQEHLHGEQFDKDQLTSSGDRS